MAFVAANRSVLGTRVQEFRVVLIVGLSEGVARSEPENQKQNCVARKHCYQLLALTTDHCTTALPHHGSAVASSSRHLAYDNTYTRRSSCSGRTLLRSSRPSDKSSSCCPCDSSRTRRWARPALVRAENSRA